MIVRVHTFAATQLGILPLTFDPPAEWQESPIPHTLNFRSGWKRTQFYCENWSELKRCWSPVDRLHLYLFPGGRATPAPESSAWCRAWTGRLPDGTDAAGRRFLRLWKETMWTEGRQRGTGTRQRQDNNRKATVPGFIPNHTPPPRAPGRPIMPLPPPSSITQLTLLHPQPASSSCCHGSPC